MGYQESLVAFEVLVLLLVLVTHVNDNLSVRVVQRVGGFFVREHLRSCLAQSFLHCLVFGDE